MSTYISSKIEKRKSKIGFGLFAKEKIKKNELVVDFQGGIGEIISEAKAMKLFHQGFDYMLQVGEHDFFAAIDPSQVEDGDFINHSCSPNCGIKGALQLVAMRDIMPGEEITFDYAMTESSDYEIECHCGSLECRHVIRGTDWLLPELQSRYDSFFSKYLQDKINAVRKN